MKSIKVGIILKAKEDIYMEGDGELCLKEDKLYRINDVYDDIIRISSEISTYHDWYIEEIPLYFKIGFELNENIIVL